MSIANRSHLRGLCDGFGIANAIANGSQNVASSRHRCSSSVRTHYYCSPSHHGVQYVTREPGDGMMP